MRFVVGVSLMFCWAAHAGPPHDLVADARGLREKGRYAEARNKLEALVRTDHSLPTRFELGLVYRALGERSLERAVWNGFYDDYERGGIDKKNARELTYMARAAQLLGGTKDANDLFRDAVDADRKGKDGAHANIAWARLFLEKYDAGHAEVCLEEALAILPEDSEGRTLLARVKLEQTYDLEAAARELARAEKAHPHHAEAIAMRAEVDLQSGRADRARALATSLLKRNPADVAARTLLAGAALLAEDVAGYEAERTKVLAVNPHDSRFFHGVSEILIREHRYADAVALEEAALLVDPKDPVARAAYGANLLRLGRETEGLAALRESWKGDKYNVRTYNLLQLFEDVIPKRYTMIEAPPFRLRVPTAERAVLEATVVPLLQQARVAFDALYETKLKGPITVELYSDPKHYAVRTVGLPGLEAIGVTFGPVITAMSPSIGKFNWGMVVWHELAHVYAITASKSRVPRWFTEGLSEYETQVQNPRWTRRTSAELAGALQRGELASVAELNQAFVAARDLTHMVIAYHEASTAVSYFVERAQRKGVRRALAAFADGRDLATVIHETTGDTIAAFDAGLKTWLGNRLARFQGQLLLRPADYSDVETLEARWKAQPNDARTRGLLALGKLAGGHADEAEKLLQTDATSLEIAYARVQLQLSSKHLPEAKAALAALRSAGGSGADVELLAARVHHATGELIETWDALTAAAAADPDRAEPHLQQAALAAKMPAGSTCRIDVNQCTERALTAALPLEIMDASIGKRLFKLRAAADKPDAIAAAEQAFEATPFDAALRLDLADFAVHKHDNATAKRELALVEASDPSAELKARATEIAARMSPAQAKPKPR